MRAIPSEEKIGELGKNEAKFRVMMVKAAYSFRNIYKNR